MPRYLTLLTLLAALAAAQEAGRRPAVDPSPHDALGFPVTFNDDLITRNDVLRLLPPEEARGEGSVKAALEQVLMEKIVERIGQIWRIEIDESQVDDFIRQQIEISGSEAKFFENLYQRGETLERFRERTRSQILQAHLDYMLTRGITPASRFLAQGKGAPPRFLPVDPMPTPAEVRIAFANDEHRRAQATRVRALLLELDISREERTAVMRELLAEDRVGEVEAEIRRRVAKRLEEVQAQLTAGRPFPEVAAARGLDVEGQGSKWRMLPSEESSDPPVRFLQTAAAGETSEPLPRAGGSILLVHVLAREEADTRGLEDPDVNAAYTARIGELRRRKMAAILRLQALDRSTVEPARVRRELRDLLLAALREAQQELRDLGIH